MDTVVNDLQFIGSDPTFINKLVHSQKHPHVGCLYSEGKAIKPTNLKLVAKHAFLQAPTLKIGWQAPEGILALGLDITQKYPKHPDTLKH